MTDGDAHSNDFCREKNPPVLQITPQEIVESLCFYFLMTRSIGGSELQSRIATETLICKGGTWPYQLVKMFDCVTSQVARFIRRDGNCQELVEINGRARCCDHNRFCG